MRRTLNRSFRRLKVAEGDVGRHVEVREQRALLRHVADPACLRRHRAYAVPGHDRVAECDAARPGREEARDQAQQIVDSVRPLSTEFRMLPIPQSAEDLPVIVHAALLVHRDREPAVVRVIETARKEIDAVGFSISFSGPWAPYRFVQHERSA